MAATSKPRAEYPDSSHGCKVASRARKMANSLSDDKRESHFRQGMAMIYGAGGKKTVVPRR